MHLKKLRFKRLNPALVHSLVSVLSHNAEKNGCLIVEELLGQIICGIMIDKSLDAP